MTIPGIGPVVASTVLASVGDISRFRMPEKLSCYLGLTPKVRQSGDRPARHGRISKQGNAHVRKMLVEAGWSGWRAACSRRAEGQWSLCCRKRIARPMRAAGIADVSRRRSAPITTVQATGHHPVISSAATSWPSDPTSSEWPTSPSCRRWPARSLAVVLDTWSRIIGWAFSADLKTRVALAALDMALVARARQWIRASFVRPDSHSDGPFGGLAPQGDSARPESERDALRMGPTADKARLRGDEPAVLFVAQTNGLRRNATAPGASVIRDSRRRGSLLAGSRPISQGLGRGSLARVPVRRVPQLHQALPSANAATGWSSSSKTQHAWRHRARRASVPCVPRA